MAAILALFLGLYFAIKLKKGYTNRVKINFNWFKSDYHKTLKRYFPYFNQLPPKDKKKFVRRIIYFMSIKNFIPKDFKEVTKEMKTLISASAIQLTFGLPEIYMSHFKNIEIYQDNRPEYIEPTSKNKGEGTIVLSWHEFLSGYIHPSGSLNHGLMEMAAALHVENTIMNQEYQFLSEQHLKEWKNLSCELIRDMNEGREKFFKGNKIEDHNQLFPIVVESFFERPFEFNQYHPETYRVISGLLNQNPLRLFQSVSIN
jgi:hypothetical protein